MFDRVREDTDRYTFSSGSSRLHHLLLTQGVWAAVEYRFGRWVLCNVRIPIVRGILVWLGVFRHKVIQITTWTALFPTADIQVS